MRLLLGGQKDTGSLQHMVGRDTCAPSPGKCPYSISHSFTQPGCFSEFLHTHEIQKIRCNFCPTLGRSLLYRFLITAGRLETISFPQISVCHLSDMDTFNAFVTPSPHQRFSRQYFRGLTMEEAASLDDYPVLAPPSSVTAWDWTYDEVRSVSAVDVSPGEVLPHASDLRQAYAGLRDAYDEGARSILVNFKFSGEEYQYCYTLSKVN